MYDNEIINKSHFNKSLKRQDEAEVKTISEQSKNHWRHKPYKCDFGSEKNETL